MTLLAQVNPPPLWFSVVLVAAIWGFLGVWGSVLIRRSRGLPILPFQRRRPVPWRGVDVLLVLAAGIALLTVFHGLVVWILGPELTRLPAISDPENSNAAHVITRLIAEGNLRVFVLCAFSAALVAPIVEEFLFRLLLQGWLEALQRRLRRSMPLLGRVMPGGFVPILLTSVVFARMHFRVETPMAHPYYYLGLMLGTSVAGLLTMYFAIKFLPLRVGATANDLGWSAKHFFADVRLGLVAFAGLAAPIYAVQFALLRVLPEYVAPDPFVLFFFAIALGVLYHRTHRIVPSIVLHMSLNTMSLVIALLALQK
ncbi:MAG: CPBP family glutamic-type intramembrane protease [Thermoguttaceae bacterium]